MKLTFFKGAALGVVTSVLTLGATSAFAGSGIGAVFNLGKVNTVNATSTLTGSASGSMLKIPNTNTAPGSQAISASSAGGTAATIRAQNTRGGPAAEFDVTAGHAPFTVNSATEVPNLNAATLRGKVPSNFYAAGSTVANSNQLGGQPPSFYLPATGTAANSNQLGGQPPSFYLPATGTAANSSELGGLPPSAYSNRLFAVVPAAGGLLVGHGVSSTQHDGTGSYDVRFTGSIANTANCAVFAQLMSGIGWVIAEPSTEGMLTEFDVLVFNTAGNPADAQFSLFAVC
jgi:hypothetical protein